MNNFALEIWDDEGTRCTFYTVKQDGLTDNETDRFFDRFTEDKENEHYDAALELYQLISDPIKNKYGATNDFVNRNEARAQALPPKPNDRLEEIAVLGNNFPLRLFCYRINEKILILFNGGIKSAATAQDSLDLKTKFNDAQAFVKRIEDHLKHGLIEIDHSGRFLTDGINTTDIYLH